MVRFAKIAAVAASVMALALALCGCSAAGPYQPTTKDATISTPAIANAGVLRVGVNTSNPPLAGQTSKIVGIDADVAAAIADEFGLKLELVDVGSDAAGALEKGKADIALGVESSNTDSSIWKSDSYLQTGVVLFSSKADAKLPAATDDVKIAAQMSSMSAWSVTNEFGASALSAEADLKTAFGSLANGSAQFVAADAIIGSYSAHSAGVTAHIVGLLQQPGGYCCAVLDKNADLKGEISNVLAKLTKNGVISLIEKKWLGASIDLKDVALTDGAKGNTKKAPATTDDKDKKDDKAAKAEEPAAEAAAEEPAAEEPAAEEIYYEEVTYEEPVYYEEPAAEEVVYYDEVGEAGEAE